MEKTRVIFNKFAPGDSFDSDTGDVIALFVDDVYSNYQPDLIQSYMHVGQHGGASRDLIFDLDHATPAEYKDLQDELTLCIGYDLQVIDISQLEG